MVEIKKNVDKLAGSITYQFYKHHYNASVQANHQMNQEFDQLSEKEQDVWVSTGQDSVDALMEIVMNIAQKMKDDEASMSPLSELSELDNAEPMAPKEKSGDISFDDQ